MKVKDEVLTNCMHSLKGRGTAVGLEIPEHWKSSFEKNFDTGLWEQIEKVTSYLK